jgi:glutamate--cysteine ligase catalytic subunit
MMGVGDFVNDPLPFQVPFSQSEYVPDYVINPHPRFAALTRNIRARRGEKVNIKIPLFKDENTPEFSLDSSARNALPKDYKFEEDRQIHMDCMAFGMGMCCLVSGINSITLWTRTTY